MVLVCHVQRQMSRVCGKHDLNILKSLVCLCLSVFHESWVQVSPCSVAVCPVFIKSLGSCPSIFLLIRKKSYIFVP
uniref:Uncharacterized protein n=1 Tax=Arundo donax TaxID=35708 RepID=A0A0A9CDX9_ARUDO